MREPAQALAAAVAFQLDCWQNIASSPKASTRDRDQARKNFLALLAKYPDIATEYGYAANNVSASGASTGGNR
jgi:hypothetical protein